MSKRIQKIFDTVKKMLVFLSGIIKELLILLKGEHRKLVMGGLVFLLLQTLTLCCVLSSPGGKQAPAFDATHIAATIYTEVESTLGANNAAIGTPTSIPQPSPTASSTPDPISVIFTKYPCLPSNSSVEIGNVVEVVDGDTIKVEIEGQIKSIRYIGVDCPECKDPDRPVQMFSQEAYERNRDLVQGSEVIMIKDVSEEDKYDRLLRYVIVDDIFVNAELIKQGYAHAVAYPPDVACDVYFNTLQRQANAAKRGFWSDLYMMPTITVEPTEDARAGCDPCYPDVCIPDVSYDLDCRDISFRRFRCICDPHGFDGDNDGIGCESG